MLAEALEQLNVVSGGTYLDCTFGAGGYAGAILEKANCKVVALDQDPTVQKYADQIKGQFPQNFEFLNVNFASAAEALEGQKFDGVVMDLGVSSMQLDQGDRGFSFMQDGPLDMRMSNSGVSAADFINSAEEKELADVIYKYGEEPLSRRIAKAIILERKNGDITTTLQFAEVVRKACGFKRGKIDQATKTFQAIRIYINQELFALEKFLKNIPKMMNSKGRLVVVSFHSLEDSIVKEFFKENSPKIVARSKYKEQPKDEFDNKVFRILTKKPIFPSEQEVKFNPRSRSARMRVVEKIGD
jgi:16S rRNA (cytosine1402-N4)-methyltransferase